MRNEAQGVERVGSNNNIYIAVVSAIVILAYAMFYLYPKFEASKFKDITYDLTTEPSGAKVIFMQKSICDATPCSFTLSTQVAPRIKLEKLGYLTHVMKLHFPDRDRDRDGELERAIGDEGKGISVETTVQLMPLIPVAEVEEALSECQKIRDALPKDILKENTLESTPCLRTPPRMPKMAKKSGYCDVLFDVDRRGDVKNLRLPFCTEDIFRRPTETVVTTWKFLPSLSIGVPYVTHGIKNKVTFRLVDEDDNLIPGPGVEN